MAYLVHPLPLVHVWVREEYLHDHKSNHGKLTPGVWVSVKSVPGKALYFETLLTEYGALYDKLPISAFQWKPIENELSLDVLELWDCFDYNITVIKKPLLGRCEFHARNKQTYSGSYQFTIDTCHGDSGIVDTNFSEFDPEHKSFNIIKLDNGQFAAQPNNRVRWFDKSLIPDTLKIPTFKVCTQNYNVEKSNGSSFGHTDDWHYKTIEETTK